VLLGAIIERATGTPYYVAVAKYVYAPAGMSATSSPIYNEPIGAIGYTRMVSEELGILANFDPPAASRIAHRVAEQLPR
jgi:CubicO group peptidase (beta-lactamase class C family)